MLKLHGHAPCLLISRAKCLIQLSWAARPYKLISHKSGVTNMQQRHGAQAPSFAVGAACRLNRVAEKLRAARVEMTAVATVVEATSAPMSSRDKLRPLMDIIYKQVQTRGVLRLAASKR